MPLSGNNSLRPTNCPLIILCTNLCGAGSNAGERTRPSDWLIVGVGQACATTTWAGAFTGEIRPLCDQWTRFDANAWVPRYDWDWRGQLHWLEWRQRRNGSYAKTYRWNTDIRHGTKKIYRCLVFLNESVCVHYSSIPGIGQLGHINTICRHAQWVPPNTCIYIYHTECTYSISTG